MRLRLSLRTNVLAGLLAASTAFVTLSAATPADAASAAQVSQVAQAGDVVKAGTPGTSGAAARGRREQQARHGRGHRSRQDGPRGRRAPRANMGVRTHMTLPPRGGRHMTPNQRDARRAPVGFSTGFGIIEQPIDQVRSDLREMSRLGVKRIRIDISWARVQLQPGTFDWAPFDRVLDAARDADIKVLGIVGYEPAWAQRNDSRGRPRPVDPQAFAAFVDKATDRYADRVGAWEIWNEPNLRQFWRATPDPVDYSAVVRAAAPKIRQNDPRATILVGALSPANDEADGSGVSPYTFMKGVYANVDPSLFDAVSVHPYCWPAMPSGHEEWNTFFRMDAIHKLMVDKGDGRKKIWSTEYGAPTGSSDVSISMQAQSDMIVAGIREARSRDYLGPLYLYSLRDAWIDPYDREANFGVLKNDGSEKPAAVALRRELRGN